MSAAHEDRLARYVEAGLAELDAGVTPDPARLCADAPELAAEVAALLGLEAALHGLHERTAGTDRWIGVELAGRYRLDARLGAGAMGTVYRALDRELGRDVAVKLLAGGGFAGETLRARFLREAEICAQLRHDHVVAIHDRGQTEEGTLFLVMELLDGVPLSGVPAATRVEPRAAYRSPRFLAEACRGVVLGESSPLRQVVRWCAEVADGLAAVHALGVVHRDVKPSNVFIDRRGRAVLLDFGIAARPEDAGLTRAGSHIGTPWYMAPELARGAVAGTAADVYGLGATLYHLLALRPPFEGSPEEVLDAVLRRDPPRLGVLHPDLPRDLAAIVEQAMACDPRDRHPSAAALADDLRAFLDHRPVSARPLGPLRRGWRRVRRQPAKAIALAASLVAVLALGVAWPAWSAWRAGESAQEYRARLDRLPALLTIEGWPAQRMLVGDEERSGQLAELDRLLELAPDDFATRALRAAVLLDVGAADRAAADLDAIAAASGSALAAALAGRYRALPAGTRGIAALDLAGLPPAHLPVDHFLVGFHAMRDHSEAGFRSAADHLVRARDWTPARDLRLIALLGTEDLELVREALAEARDLESLYGRPTARTRHTIGAALLHLRRYDEALPVLRDAVAIRPDRHGPHNNLGLALLRTGDLPAAREELLRAHAIRPWLCNTLELLSQVEADLGDFDAAYDWAAQITSPDGDGTEIWNRPYAEGSVATKQAAAAHLHRDDQTALRCADRARAAFRRALELAPPRRYAVSAKLLLPFLDGQVVGEPARGFGAVASQVLGAPLDPHALRNLVVALPTDLDADHRAVLEALLLEQAAALSPGAPAFRADADDQRERLGLPRKGPTADVPAADVPVTREDR